MIEDIEPAWVRRTVLIVAVVIGVPVVEFIRLAERIKDYFVREWGNDIRDAWKGKP